MTVNAQRRAAGLAEPPSADPFREYMLVELLGHRRVAGLVTEQQVAGVGFLRIDIPDVPEETAVHMERALSDLHPRAVEQHEEGHDCSYWCRKARPGIPATTQFVAPSSIYAMHPITEATARQMAISLRVEAINRLDLPQRLQLGRGDDEVPFGDEA